MKLATLFERWFVIPTDTRRLGLFRIATAYTFLSLDYCWVSPRHLENVPIEFAQPVLVAWPLFIKGMPPDALLAVLPVALKILLVLLLLGLRTRLVRMLTALVALWYAGVDNSFGKVTCLLTPLYMTLLIGVFAPWGDALSLDAYLLRTPVSESRVHGVYCRLIHALMALFLLGAALQKLRTNADGWLFGDELRAYLFDLYQPDHAAPFAKELLMQPELCRVFGILSVLFEGTFWVSFFSRRLALFYFFAGALFHLGIYLTMNIDPGSITGWYLILIPWERWIDLRRVPVRRESV